MNNSEGTFVMDNWVLPYKQIVLDSGLLVLYERTVESDTGDALLFQLVKTDNAFYFQVGAHHLVPLDARIIECLMKTKRLCFAVSEKEDLNGTMVGILDIDEISIGKLIAYLEVTAGISITPSPP